ncbi:GIY-YIG nuclease family protein [Streptomyces sp. DH10]|uniref:GIY-YIG nuclease family protein n=1 Tax=Streptomyces sp. DH10 TaxID=3040121 RepID=UPI003FA73B3A
MTCVPFSRLPVPQLAELPLGGIVGFKGEALDLVQGLSPCIAEGDDRVSQSVYVIGAPRSLTVKIGFTNDLARRRREIQYMCPVEVQVLWSCPGGPALEQALHDRFTELRSHGEWFTFEADPVETVRRAIESGQVRRPHAAPSGARQAVQQPPPVDLDRVAHGSLWRTYGASQFTVADAAERLGYGPATLLERLVALVGKGHARRRQPIRTDPTRQLFTVRPCL